MKIPCRLSFALLTVCAALPVGGLRAQAPAALATATPSVSAPAKAAVAPAEAEENEGGMRRALEVLTPEERQTLRAAHKAALQDPSVKAAEATRSTDKRGYRQAMRAAMLKADPNVGPILAKMRESKPNRKNG